MLKWNAAPTSDPIVNGLSAWLCQFNFQAFAEGEGRSFEGLEGN